MTDLEMYIKLLKETLNEHEKYWTNKLSSVQLISSNYDSVAKEVSGAVKEIEKIRKIFISEDD